MNDKLNELRAQIDEVDEQIKQLLLKRINVVLQMDSVKKQHGIPVTDSVREKKVLEGVTKDLNEQQRDYVYNVYLEIIKNSKNLQK